ncbi:hypothetical protein [Limnohabitans sp.]|uniref:hypothetical protein n=1 Tax=Limnohabitans sp. TaxID=1907725 RepID=UPI00286F1F0F|nr:hypothetical protein [Limnohabitans sp.]
MRHLRMAVVSLSVFSMGHLASAVEPVAKPQAKQTKRAAAKQALAKPRPEVPKYHDVRATSLSASPVAATPVAAPVQSVQAIAPEVGEVHTGHMVCELGNAVTVMPDQQQPTRFVVQMKKHTYFMTPVQTATGAVRLEDTQAGAMWLQLPNKSMLMNSKLGQRMADECQSERQMTEARRIKLDLPSGLLDAATLAKK